MNKASTRSRPWRRVIAGVWIGLLLLENSCARADEPPAPLEAYGRLPTLEDLSLSPDGTELAYVRTVGDQRNLMVHRLGESQALGTVQVGDAKLRGIRWIDNDHLLLMVSSTSLPPFGFGGPQREWYDLIIFDVPRRKLSGLYMQVGGERTFNVVTGAPMIREVDGASTLFVPGLYVTGQMLPALYKIEIAGGRVRLIARASEPWTQWLVDAAGRIAGEFVYHDQRKTWDLLVRRNDRMSVVASGAAAVDVPLVLGFGPAGDSILVRTVENGVPVWKAVWLKDGSWGPPPVRGEAFMGEILERKSGRIIGGFRDIDGAHYVFFDNELQAHWNAVLRAFPDERVHLLSASDDYSRILVRVFGAKDGYVYAMFDWYSHQAVVLGKVYEDLQAVAEVRPISYPAADGLIIPGYLTLPHGRTAARLPLIVLPHGGPALVDSGDFDWWAQALAAEGYAVLQPNYRGSPVDSRFLAAGFGEWGRKMQTDLSDGVRYLANEGLIDPARVCIVGGSYGGYAALAGMALDPGVYRCAVSVAGISDLKRFLQWTDSSAGRGDSHSQRYWDRYMGASGPGDRALQAISPIEHVNAVTGPVLLIHGRDDTVVPYEQSDVMAAALKRAGKSVDLVALKHEDHWLSRSATRLQMLEAMVAFLRTNNPPL